MTNRNDNDPFAGIEPYEDFTGGGGHEPPPPPVTPQQAAMAPRSPLLTGLVLGLLLVVVSIGLFQLLGDDGEAEVAAPADTTVPADDTAGDTTPAETAGDTTGDSGTTAGDDTSADPGSESAAAPYVAVGDPIPVSELALAVDGVGDIKFGQPASQAMGRLIASLGEPDEDTGVQLSVGEWGVCEGDNERVVLWGPFAAIVVVDPDGTETFAGYRLDFAQGGFSHEAADLATLSGLQAGSSLRQLEQIYADFDVRELEDPELGTIWELKSTNTGALLLWGPLTTDDTVRGIYAPDACNRF